MNSALSVSCPICESTLEIKDDTVIGELIFCEDCGTELEITSTDPLKIEEAPEVEEDWGE